MSDAVALPFLMPPPVGGAGSFKDATGRRLAEMGLGVVAALESGQITFAQARADLFNLDTYNEARRRRLGRDVTEFLEWGMELEDVAELAPRGLAQSCRKMRALAERIIRGGATVSRKRNPRR